MYFAVRVRHLLNVYRAGHGMPRIAIEDGQDDVWIQIRCNYLLLREYNIVVAQLSGAAVIYNLLLRCASYFHSPNAPLGL